VTVKYVEQPPGRPLSRYVEAFCWMRRPAGGVAGPPHKVLPDRCLELLLHLRDPFAAGSDPARLTAQPRAVLVGQLTGGLFLQPGACVDSMGIRFRPDGAGRRGRLEPASARTPLPCGGRRSTEDVCARASRPCCRRSGAGAADWAGVALDHGYFDQPHLIRDFQELRFIRQRRGRRQSASSGDQSQAAPRTPLASPCLGGSRRVSTRSEKTYRPHSLGSAS
jgi:hypothetical protein